MTKRTAPLLAVASVILVTTSSAALGERLQSIASGPVTITESGSYIVTWDISVITPPAITIVAPDVRIDLNGHSVGTPGFDNGDVILMSTGAHRLQIENGQLVGGTQCLSGATPDLSLSMDHITCTGGRFGVEIDNASAVSITHSEFSPAMDALSVRGSYSLQFEANSVRQALPYPEGFRCGATFHGITHGTISGNVFDCTAYDGTVLNLTGTGVTRVVRNSLTGHDTRGCLQLDGRFIVRENSIEGCRYALQSTGSGSRLVDNAISGGLALARGIEAGGSDNTIAGNLISDCLYGITVGGSSNRISGNSVLRSMETGVTILGTENLISGNRIESNAAHFSEGLVLRESSSFNVYKNNDLRGTTGIPIQDFGTDNVDAGGNVW